MYTRQRLIQNKGDADLEAIVGVRSAELLLGTQRDNIRFWKLLSVVGDRVWVRKELGTASHLPLATWNVSVCELLSGTLQLYRWSFRARALSS